MDNFWLTIIGILESWPTIIVVLMLVPGFVFLWARATGRIEREDDL